MKTDGTLTMPNAQLRTAKRILMVEDDAELRGALLEQLKLHEEFEPVAAESADMVRKPSCGGQSMTTTA